MKLELVKEEISTLSDDSLVDANGATATIVTVVLIPAILTTGCPRQKSEG